MSSSPEPLSRVIGRWRPDAASAATFLLALQFLIPARLVVGGLGAAGRPSAAVGLFLGIMWLGAFLTQRRHEHSCMPVRFLMFGLVTSWLVGLWAGFDRGLPADETRESIRWLIMMVSCVGLALWISDGVRNRERLDTLIGRVVLFATVMAAVGIIQSLAATDITQYLKIPGLKANLDLVGLKARGQGQIRVAGTATHYIEFGVVLAMLLPLAVHRVLFCPALVSAAQRWGRWSCLAIMVMALPLSLSRAAIVGLAVAGTLMMLVWTWRWRFVALAALATTVVLVKVAKPGVIGTLRALFRDADQDPSIQHRLDDYVWVAQVFSERPWFGRGVATLMPAKYLLLDNQYLNTLLTCGLLGLVSLVAMMVVPYLLARSIRTRAPASADRHLGQALAAGMAVAGVTAATFDCLSFSTYTASVFVLIGLVGALCRLSGPLPVTLAVSSPDDVVLSPLMANDLKRRVRAFPRLAVSRSPIRR